VSDEYVGGDGTLAEAFAEKENIGGIVLNEKQVKHLDMV
jgi:hypothetical protein